MKTIWFDLSNSPHINLFSGLIRELKKKYNIVITTRNLGNSIELLEREKLPYTIVGKYYRSGKIKKSYAFVNRIFQLKKFLKDKNVSLAVSQSSFQSPPAANLLGIKSLYMNDNEHAQGNIPAFIFATKILLPEYFPEEIAKKQFASMDKIIYYPGLKEGIYLWNKPNLFFDDEKQLNNNTVYIRPEPWTAMYYRGRRNFLDNLIFELSKDGFNIVILPRDIEQANHYKSLKFKNLEIGKSNLSLEQITQNCRLFIGAGGTMTREMAILGFPTISVYQDELLEVDKYLISKGMLVHYPNLNYNIVNNILKNKKQMDNNYKMSLLNKGQRAYILLKKTIIQMAEEE